MNDALPEDTKKPPLDFSKVDQAKTDAAFLSQLRYEFFMNGPSEPVVRIHLPYEKQDYVTDATYKILRQLGIAARSEQPTHGDKDFPVIIKGEGNIEKLLNLPIDNPVIASLQEQLGIKISDPSRFKATR